MKYKKDRKICFTIPADNYNINKFYEIYENNKDKIKYMIIGEENSKTGFHHYQCYVQLIGNQMRRKQFQEMIGFKCHMENQKGTNKEARNYCWKGQFEDKGTEYPQPSSITIEFGKFCETQGERSNMKDIKMLLDNGQKHYDIINKNEAYLQSYARYHSFYEKYKNWTDDERLNKIRNIVEGFIIFGDPGTGKTTSIYKKYGVKNCYCLNNPNKDNKCWNGYNNQKILILDDFYSWLPVGDMNKIIDNKPFQVRKLMGYRWAQWEKVYITSNQDPKYWYPNMRYDADKKKTLEAFFSRIKKCLKVSRGNTGALDIKEIKLSKIKRENQKNYLDLDKFIENKKIVGLL